MKVDLDYPFGRSSVRRICNVFAYIDRRFTHDDCDSCYEELDKDKKRGKRARRVGLRDVKATSKKDILLLSS